MSGLMDLISQHIGNDQIKQMAAQLGASPEQTEAAVSLAIPTLLGAVAKKADSHDGANQLHQQLVQQDGGLMGQLGGLLNATNGQSSAGASSMVGGLLESILGGRQARVEQGIGKASGLSTAQIGSLMAMLVPLVMGALSQRQRAENMDVGGLAGMLKKEKQSMENAASGGFLAGMLDQDGDGDFDFQDVMKMGMKRLFGR